jgi:hypothetical protein
MKENYISMKTQLAITTGGRIAGAVLSLLLFLSISAFGQTTDTAAVAAGEIEQSFTLASGERLNLEFELAHPGLIQVVADWVPQGPELSLILFRPVQMNFIAREDGCSPRELKYLATEHDTERGTTWRLRIVNMTSETVSGHFLLSYPVLPETPVQ